jgi:hypothetical protein
MVAMQMMEMTVVEIVCVAVMSHGRMTAGRSMSVRVPVVFGASVRHPAVPSDTDASEHHNPLARRCRPLIVSLRPFGCKHGGRCTSSASMSSSSSKSVHAFARSGE